MIRQCYPSAGLRQSDVNAESAGVPGTGSAAVTEPQKCAPDFHSLQNNLLAETSLLLDAESTPGQLARWRTGSASGRLWVGSTLLLSHCPHSFNVRIRLQTPQILYTQTQLYYSNTATFLLRFISDFFSFSASHQRYDVQVKDKQL